VANAKMAGAIRLVSIERGHDPARFAAMPFGGGGALHAGALMQEVGLGAALVPRFPGVTSALGCVVADMRHDRVQTVNRRLDEIDAAALGEAMARIAGATEAVVRASGTAFDRVDRVFELDMLYLGQTHTVAVPVALPEGGLTREDILAAFEGAYRAAYGRLLAGIPARVMNLRVAVIGRRPAFDLSRMAPEGGKAAADCRTGLRLVRAGGADHEAPVYDRLSMAPGETVAGPAILEQPDTTIFVDPGLTARVDALGNLVITRSA
jgi:N-methylhydantoinase A